jgi:hypothetical protein
MILAATILLITAVLAFVLLVRPRDAALAIATSAVAYLEERKGVVDDNLRDLNFEFGLGKLSAADYERSKALLEEELAMVTAEIARRSTAAPPKPASDPLRCPHCGARFDKPMKFCGECGKTMPEVQA